MGDGDDAVLRVGCVLALRQLIKDGQTHADVFIIGELVAQNRSKKAGAINQVFQGKNPDTTDRSQLLYGGDREFVSASRVSLHLRDFQSAEREYEGAGRAGRTMVRDARARVAQEAVADTGGGRISAGFFVAAVPGA